MKWSIPKRMSFKNAARSLTAESGQHFDALNTIVQWHNGDQQFAPLGNGALALTGGFIVVKDKIVGDIRKAGWPEQTVKIGGNPTQALVAPRAYFAIIASRSRWETFKNPRTGNESNTKRIQILAVPFGC